MKRTLLGLACLLPAVLASALGCMSSGETGPNDGTGGRTDDNAAGGGSNTSTEIGADAPEVTGSKAGGHDVPLQEGRELATDKAEFPACKGDGSSVTFYMSADDSNSMASPVIAREMLLQNLAPEPARIRTYEFLNYYNALYPEPAADTLGVHVELQDSLLASTVPGAKLRLQIGVQAPSVKERPDMVITFVVDSSGSLIGPGIERERALLQELGPHLGPGDVVNVVTWSTDDNVLLEGYAATGTQADNDKLADVVGQLNPGGGSDLHAGLLSGYKLALDHFDAKKLNRVVLVSDGGANLGVVDRDLIADAAEDADEQGVYLVGVGVGPAQGYSDTLMDLVTDSGRGAYVYLDDVAEAKEVFGARFEEVMDVGARDVQIQVALPAYLEIDDFYGEEYSPYATEVKPQTLAPGDAMILNQTVYIADPEKACGLDTVTVTVTWETPIEHTKKSVGPLSFTLSELLAPPTPQALKANAVIAYAEALKIGTKATLTGARKVVQEAADATEYTDLDDILALIDHHPAMK